MRLEPVNDVYRAGDQALPEHDLLGLLPRGRIDMADGDIGVGLDHLTGDRQLAAHDCRGCVTIVFAYPPDDRGFVGRRHGRPPTGQQCPGEPVDRLRMLIDHAL